MKRRKTGKSKLQEMDQELLYKFFEGKTTKEQEVFIRKWLETSDENYRTFLQERKMFDALILQAETKQIKPGWRNVVSNRKIWKEVGKIAAVFAIALMGAFAYVHFSEKQDFLASTQKIMVPAGYRINLELSDGTVVWLNSRSSLQYPAAFAGDRRTVQLDGEAYFEVARNEDVPFIVETTKGNIEVLGTKFNVEAYSDDRRFVTSLIEGSVKVVTNNNQLYLQPDQMAFLENGKLKMAVIDDYNVYRWREGLICFKDEPLINILKKFEKCYGVEIRFENDKIQNTRFSGKFRQSDGIQYALRVLQLDAKFKFERDENNHIIYIK